MVGVEGLLGMPDYERGEIFHDICSLNMEVSQYRIREPASNGADDAAVHTRVEEGHRSGGRKRYTRDIFGKETNGGG